MVVGGSDGHDSASDALELLALNPGQETDCLKNLMHPCPAKLEGAMRDYSTPSQGIMGTALGKRQKSRGVDETYNPEGWGGIITFL